MSDQSNIYSLKHLIIPEYVIPSDIVTIYNYFEKYQIAKLKHVNYHEDNKIMYEDPTSGEHLYYGYATIEVDEWYENNGSKSFYESMLDNNCKMVFDDPEYWEIYFDDKAVDAIDESNNYCDAHNYDNIHYTNDEVECNPDDYDEENRPELQDYPEEEKDDYVEIKLEDNHEPVSYLKEEEDDDEDKEDDDEDKEDDDEDKDSDYVFNEEDNCPDDDEYEYEYEYKYYKKIDGVNTRSKSKAKENPGNDKSLSEIIIKKNKNYLKNNKKKEYKNVWSRRLRRKLSC